jgi:hypothetical protein
MLTDGHAAWGAVGAWCSGGFVFSASITYCDGVKRIALALALAACGGPAGPATPAADGVRAYLQALRSDDAHAAYGMLSHDARKNLSFDEFALQWKQSAAERAWQIKALEESLKGNPDVGERALISFSDGKLVTLEREGIAKQVEGFIAGLAKHANGPIDNFGSDRAELRWDENGVRYRIVLRKEDDEWRVDDISIRTAPKEDEGDKGGVEVQPPEDF